MLAIPRAVIVSLGRKLLRICIYLSWRWVSSVKRSKRRFSTFPLLLQRMWESITSYSKALKAPSLWNFIYKSGKRAFGPKYFCSYFVQKRLSFWELEFFTLFCCKSVNILYFSSCICFVIFKMLFCETNNYAIFIDLFSYINGAHMYSLTKLCLYILEIWRLATFFLVKMALCK